MIDDFFYLSSVMLAELLHGIRVLPARKPKDMLTQAMDGPMRLFRGRMPKATGVHRQSSEVPAKANSSEKAKRIPPRAVDGSWRNALRFSTYGSLNGLNGNAQLFSPAPALPAGNMTGTVVPPLPRERRRDGQAGACGRRAGQDTIRKSGVSSPRRTARAQPRSPPW